MKLLTILPASLPAHLVLLVFPIVVFVLKMVMEELNVLTAQPCTTQLMIILVNFAAKLFLIAMIVMRLELELQHVLFANNITLLPMEVPALLVASEFNIV